MESRDPEGHRHLGRREGRGDLRGRPTGDLTGASQSSASTRSREYAWTFSEHHPWLYRGEHTFRLEAIDAHRTRYVDRETFHGLLVPLRKHDWAPRPRPAWSPWARPSSSASKPATDQCEPPAQLTEPKGLHRDPSLDHRLRPGLGQSAAAQLLADGHQVVIHARNHERAATCRDLAGHGTSIVVGDLATQGETRDVAEQVNQLGRMDAIIHNAGVYGDIPRHPTQKAIPGC